MGAYIAFAAVSSQSTGKTRHGADSQIRLPHLLPSHSSDEFCAPQMYAVEAADPSLPNGDWFDPFCAASYLYVDLTPIADPAGDSPVDDARGQSCKSLVTKACFVKTDTS